ncbi:hypothetical protein EBZ39_14455 [bacterium]|nr:hypothetical protein [bacterium]
MGGGAFFIFKRRNLVIAMFKNLVVYKNQTLEGIPSRASLFVIDKSNRLFKMARNFLSHTLTGFHANVKRTAAPQRKGPQ